MKRISMAAACALACMGVSQTARAQSGVLGRWLTDDGAGVVKIESCGRTLCGKLVSVRDPKAPDRDINNPDPDKRQRPLVGISILTGLVRDDDGWGDGRVYDPKAGRSYRASISLAEDGRLDVTGCVLFLCRTKHWTRLEEKSG
ncbi:DUF2147 domain-containing protein [Novosphingobium malaysiense]|uniref:DUF2147 domain-containing protein n=1 Tax=Novosphingobium malaysiense TaxID=1348853 RepID=A0A0B1ZLZ3_9SPHN|nr:DUF2147 domain-containing protein [Novosphingobium malaysiense]KHK90310.1 hypothetical protein LK12_16980 [Novosphingobium malaysiense]